jgi:hypothetical protein
VRVSVLGVATLSLAFLLLAAAPSHAQTPPPAPPAPSQAPPPVPGFMPAYEVTRVVRSAGFDPLAPPLREGTTYVLRATDFRGILMRVVVDAHSGAIRAVNRIVAGPGPYGQIGMMPPPYDAPLPSGGPDYEGAAMAPSEEGAFSPPPPAVHPAVSVFPPLPRARPAELASRKAAVDAASAPVAAPPVKPDVKSDAPAAAPAPGKAPPSAPLND